MSSMPNDILVADVSSLKSRKRYLPHRLWRRLCCLPGSTQRDCGQNLADFCSKSLFLKLCYNEISAKKMCTVQTQGKNQQEFWGHPMLKEVSVEGRGLWEVGCLDLTSILPLKSSFSLDKVFCVKKCGDNLN